MTRARSNVACRGPAARSTGHIDRVTTAIAEAKGNVFEPPAPRIGDPTCPARIEGGHHGPAQATGDQVGRDTRDGRGASLGEVRDLLRPRPVEVGPVPDARSRPVPRGIHPTERIEPGRPTPGHRRRRPKGGTDA